MADFEKKPEALRLAEMLSRGPEYATACRSLAALELKRQHAELDLLRHEAAELRVSLSDTRAALIGERERSARQHAELKAVRADFTALQKAAVGDSGASAILTINRMHATIAALTDALR